VHTVLLSCRPVKRAVFLCIKIKKFTLQTCSQSQLKKKDENKRIIIAKTLVLCILLRILIVDQKKERGTE